MTAVQLVGEAPAKVNLFLRVLARETTGYHGIETLFCRLRLADTVSVTRTDRPGVSLTVEGPDLGPAEANLATRAAERVPLASKSLAAFVGSLARWRKLADTAMALADRAMAAWSEILGHEQARLWMNARATEGRGR